jgi:aminoglycoside 3-N-acetyltransferase
MAAAVGRVDIREAIQALGLAEQPVCVHCSLSSFGHVSGGADALIDAFVDEGCTVLVPTFSGGIFGLAPPEGMRPARNGIEYETAQPSPGAERVFTPESNEVGASMGAFPAALLARPDRARGAHPLNSFAALGPQAESLVAGQRPLDVYAPLRILAARGGFVLLIGVGLDRMTLLHLAEEKAGRALFRRWANAPDGRPQEVEIGSCSNGFGNLESALAPLVRETRVGASAWQAFPARETLAAAQAAIRSRPDITHCGAADCLRCRDAVAGGPLAAVQLSS